MDRLLPILIAIVVLLVLGAIDEIVTLAALNRRRRFTIEYQQRWDGFARDYIADRASSDDYVWLSRNQPKMSGELGPEGFIIYRAPYAQFASAHYPILPNTLSRASTSQAHPNDFPMVNHILITHEGALTTASENTRRELKNPFALLRRGLQFVLSLPLLLLSWSGLVSGATVERARRSVIFRFLQAVASVAALLSALVIVVTGWSAFVAQLQYWIRHPAHP